MTRVINDDTHKNVSPTVPCVSGYACIVEVGSLMGEVKDGVVDMDGDKLGPASGVANLYVNITIDAARGDRAAVLMRAAGGQLSEFAKLTAAWAKELERGGAEQAAKGVAAVTDIAMAGVKFQEELLKASDGYLNTKDEIARRRDSMRRTLTSQLQRIECRIYQLQANVDACLCPAPS